MSDLFSATTESSLEYTEAKRRRDEALAKVAREEWQQEVYGALPHIAGFVGMWETIKAKLLELDLIEKPHDPHAWGAVCKGAIKRKLIEEIPGRYDHMRADSSNGRRSQVYKVLPSQ